MERSKIDTKSFEQSSSFQTICSHEWFLGVLGIIQAHLSFRPIISVHDIDGNHYRRSTENSHQFYVEPNSVEFWQAGTVIHQTWLFNRHQCHLFYQPCQSAPPHMKGKCRIRHNTMRLHGLICSYLLKYGISRQCWKLSKQELFEMPALGATLAWTECW